MLTRVFKSGHSVAVYPKEMAFMRESDALEIELIGNTLMLRPAAAPDLQDLAEIIALFPPAFMAAGCGGLKYLQQIARERGNLFEGITEAVKTHLLGQISHALYEVGGEYRRNM